MERESALVGCLVGMAVGDALGLIAEGVSRRRQQRLYPHLDTGPSFLFGRGIVSDDTEHAILTARALAASNSDPERFRQELAWRLRWWLAGCPPGIGKATALACIRLWLGWPSDRSGWFSAGNGPAMRAPVLGVCHGNDRIRLPALLRASTRLTHTDPRAEEGSLAIALAAHAATTGLSEPLAFAGSASTWFPATSPWPERLRTLAASVDRGETTADYVDTLGLARGVSGFIDHTAPACLHAWLSHPNDNRSAVLTVIQLGGDADTTGAIVGGLVGARVGIAGVPLVWRQRVRDWPLSLAEIERIGRACAEELAAGEPRRIAGPHWAWLAPLRSGLVTAVAVGHWLRRWLPPY